MKRVIIIVIAITLSQGALAMSLFGAGKTCVFSNVKATLTMNGKPLPNAKVIRRWEWQELKEDSTTTDENGHFEFPVVFEKSVTRLLPIELVIGQGLYVIVDGKEQQFWSNSKREPGENAEFNGKPIAMMCELTHEMKYYRDFGSIMGTLCTWGE